MPPRKKARTGAAKGRTAFTGGSNASDSQAPSPSSPSTAVQSKPRRTVRGRRGGLKDLPNMPLDILMEIVVLLHPRDLLNLARTSKDWRAFLMNRKQEPLWKAARIQQEPTMPDLPPFLSEPAYANLMFFKHCHGCLKPSANNIYWEFGIRLCNPYCSDLLLLRYRGENPCLHHTVIAEVGNTGYNYLACVHPPPRSRYRQRAYLHSELIDFRQRWESLPTKEEKVQFLQDCHEAVRKRTEICELLSEWDSERKADRFDELEALKQERFLAVQRRLVDEGWKKELDFMGQAGLQRLSSLKCVRKSAKLTDKVWSNMHEEVIEFMQEYRTKRIGYERRALVEQRIKLLCDAYEEQVTTGTQEQRLRHDGIELGPGDLAYVPVFAELLQAGNDMKVTKRSFLSLMAQKRWPVYVSQWKAHIQSCFKKIAVARLARMNVQVANPDNVLQLAVAEFRCGVQNGCAKQGLRWPDILKHPCFRSHYLNERPVFDLDFDASVKFVSEGDVFLVERDYTSIQSAALKIVVAYGQDPGKVTYEEMQACPARLVCDRDSLWPLPCQRPRPLLDWRAAIDHEQDMHMSEPRYARPKKSLWKMVARESAEQLKTCDVVDAAGGEQGEPGSARTLDV
ncbi:hypothetical protein C8Q73DRAFT_698062 [Cubamyces lactineus]|nr:hypothetical protein C8Q73DRAFT_698062 [Cubamyces lactineus]